MCSMFAFVLLVVLALNEGVRGQLAAYTGLVDVTASFGLPYSSSEDTLLFNNVVTDVGGLYNPTTGKVTIPTGKGGTYWLTARPDPAAGQMTELYVRVNGQTKVVAVGQRVAAGTSFALQLQDLDEVQVTVAKRDSVQGGTLFSIAETNAVSAFTAVHDMDAYYPVGGKVRFGDVVTSQGVSYNSASGEIIVNNGGLYLVNLNADGRDPYQKAWGWWSSVVYPRLDVILEVNGNKNLWAYGEGGTQSSAATLLQLSAGDVLKVRTAESKHVEKNTQVSLLQLQASPSVGFRGQVTRETSQKNPVFFTTGIDLGSIYDSSTAITTMPADDLYIVCIRPDPKSHNRLNFHVEKNGSPSNVVAYGEKGIPNGVCAALELEQGDEITIVADGNGNVETASLYSIARVA